jgi:hypothetical protein
MDDQNLPFVTVACQHNLFSAKHVVYIEQQQQQQ